MPKSVLLDPNRMTVTLLGKTSDDNAFGVAWGTIRFAGHGDINGDGKEDMVITGWTTNGKNPPAQVFFLLSTANGYVLKEGKALGIKNILGTCYPIIYDFNGDGRKDIFFPGYTDVPVTPVPSIMAIQKANGTFQKIPTKEKIAAHNGDFVDFSGDGLPDLLLANYPGSGGGLRGSLYYENTGSGLKLHLISTAPATVVNWGATSVSAGDYHKTGVPTIILADTNWLADGSGMTLKNITEVSNFIWGSDGNLVSADQKQIMTPFFNRDPRFSRAFSAWGDMKAHNICTRTLDLDGDGYQDIVMASMIWGGSPPDPDYPDHSIINIVRGTATGFSDETESRLWNYQVTRRESHHCLRVADLNGDGKPDLVGTDEGGLAENGQFLRRSTGNEVLLNDGTGNLVSVFWEGFETLQKRTLDMTKEEPNSLVADILERFFPLLGPKGELRWLTFVPYRIAKASGGEKHYLAWFLVDAGRLSSGPNMEDPSAWGVPGFSELYYLAHNPDVRDMVLRGEYSSGLAHYIARGSSEGRRISFQSLVR
jgi:hypothetical protein